MYLQTVRWRGVTTNPRMRKFPLYCLHLFLNRHVVNSRWDMRTRTTYSPVHWILRFISFSLLSTGGSTICVPPLHVNLQPNHFVAWSSRKVYTPVIATGRTVWGSKRGRSKRFFSCLQSSRPTLDPTQSPLRWMKRPGVALTTVEVKSGLYGRSRLTLHVTGTQMTGLIEYK